MTRSQLEKRVSLGSERVCAALRSLDQLGMAIADGERVSRQLALLQEATEDLLAIEDAVGVQTPLDLFSGSA